LATRARKKRSLNQQSVTGHNVDFFDVRITLGYYEYVATDRNLERGVAMPGTSLGEFLLASEQDLKGQADI